MLFFFLFVSLKYCICLITCRVNKKKNNPNKMIKLIWNGKAVFQCEKSLGSLAAILDPATVSEVVELTPHELFDLFAWGVLLFLCVWLRELTGWTRDTAFAFPVVRQWRIPGSYRASTWNCGRVEEEKTTKKTHLLSQRFQAVLT